MNKIDAVTITFLVFFGALLTSPIYLRTARPFGYVTSNSMYPTYKRGDLVIIYGKQPKKINVGEVILFKVKEVSEPVLHRVINKKKNRTGVYFKTKGDNNPYVDPWGWVSGENVFGVVVFGIPQIGYLFILIPPIFFRIIAGILAITFLISIVRDFLQGESGTEKRGKNSNMLPLNYL